MKIKPIRFDIFGGLFIPKSCFHLFPNKSHPKCILITLFTFEFESKLIGCLSILYNDIVYWSYDPAHRQWLHKTCTLHVSISSWSYKAPANKAKNCANATAAALWNYKHLYRDECAISSLLLTYFYHLFLFCFCAFSIKVFGKIFAFFNWTRPGFSHVVPVSEYKFCSLFLEVHMMYEMAWNVNYIV